MHMYYGPYLLLLFLPFFCFIMCVVSLFIRLSITFRCGKGVRIFPHFHKYSVISFSQYTSSDSDGMFLLYLRFIFVVTGNHRRQPSLYIRRLPLHFRWLPFSSFFISGSVFLTLTLFFLDLNLDSHRQSTELNFLKGVFLFTSQQLMRMNQPNHHHTLNHLQRNWKIFIHHTIKFNQPLNVF